MADSPGFLHTEVCNGVQSVQTAPVLHIVLHTLHTVVQRRVQNIRWLTY
ncbi:hypothetical protein SAMN05877838_3796 [Hoeflea halophila]|uniref:Uncharacterized protein n=1 Tax=Hoeflea halophila TaxID=714899 RepID=A0A286IFK1_9HYPH|nr:hypothetical protein SAMN05877838_3796 [Hoeflea halophila]